MRKILVSLSLLSALLLTGCATPLGQQYGTIGAIGGAIIGGAATGDIGGAAAGAAIGGLGGGLIGDQQTFENERRYQRDYPRYQRPQPRYQRPCQQVRIPLYDQYDRFVGYRYDCR